MAEIIHGYYVPIVRRDYNAQTVEMEDVPVGQHMLISDELLAQGDPAAIQRDGDRLLICGQAFRVIGPAPEGVYHDCTVLERIE